MPQTITCTITNSAGAVIPELNVRAYALQPGRETLLAEGLGNEKGECRLEYEWAGGKVLHVQVRAFSFGGAQLGASEVVYNAKTQEQIRFKVKPPAPPKEYEGIQAVLRHILPEGQTLSANEGALVVKSLAAYAGEIPKVFRQQVNESRLDYVVHCEALAAESGLPAAFIYGISRTSKKKQMLDYFVKTENASLWASLDRAEQQNYVEPLDRAELSLQLETLRRAKSPVTEQHLWGQLLNAADNVPLSGLLVRAFGPGSGDTPAGEDRTDREGRFFIRVPVPKPETAFRLDVFRGEDERIHSVQVRLQDTAHVFRLQLPALPDISPTLRQIAAETSWTQLQPHLQALEAAGLRSLQEVREKGLAQANLPAEIAQRLEAHAHLDVLPAARPAFAHDLITQGFVSPLAVARASKSELIAKMRNQYGDFTPASLHEQALTLEAGLSNFFAQELLEPGVFTQGGNGGAPEPAEDPLDLVPQSCGCQHCSNAVSPVAYLTELLVYALRHVKKGDAALTLADLQAAFYQPFGDLPATCGDANRTMRQIRLSLEVLRYYLAAHGLPAPNTPETSQFDMACQKFRQQVYFQLLENLNTSYDEIRNATPEEKEALTKRIGIPLQHDGQGTLEALFQRPEALQEAALEQLFGWRDTARAPFTEPNATPIFLQWQKAFRHQDWWNADWPETLAPEARPWIDPDLIALDYLVEPLTGAASDLWHGRRDALHNQFENYRQNRESAANDQAAWNALFPEPEVLEQIRQAGKPAGEYLDNVHRHIQGASPITTAEWENVYHILVQHFKTTHYTEWLQQEKAAGIFLSPDFFRIPPPVFNFDLAQEEDQTEWRAKRADFRDWRDRLKVRIEQDRTDAAALADAVAKAEEAHLPALRKIFIHASDAAGADLYAKASWLSERLLIDTASDAGIMTTRIQQAIESLQLLIWGIRTGQLEDTHPDWSLEAEKFDEEWKWLGHYASWRSAMLVFLYPENLLQPTLRRMQTPVFRTMVRNTRNSAQFTPKDACALAETYSQYFRDVNNLRPEASVIARTQTVAGDCSAKTGKGERSYVYLFARSTVSNKVYMARYEEGDWYEQSHWEEVPGLNQVLSVAGACVYAVTPDERYIYLFVKVQDGRNHALVYTRYDLQKDAWTGENNQLDSPPGNPNAMTFDAVVKKTYREDEPPHLAFRNREGELYGRRMNIDGSDWQDDDFVMLEAKAYIPVMRTARLCEMIESKRGEYYLIRETSAAVEYRLFGKMDDGQWRRVGPKYCLGALPWQKNGGVYVFLGDPENGFNPSYVLIRRPEQEPVKSISISKFREQEPKLGLEDYLLKRMSGLNLNEIPVNYGGQSNGLVDFLLLVFNNAPNKAEYLAGHSTPIAAKDAWIEDYKDVVHDILDLFSDEKIENKIGSNWQYVSKQTKALSGWSLGDILKKLFDNRAYGLDLWEWEEKQVFEFKQRPNSGEEISGSIASILPGLRKIVAACGEMPVNPYARIFYSIKPYGLTPPNWDSTTTVSYALTLDVSTTLPGSNPRTSLYRSTLFNPNGIQLRNVSPELAAPHTRSDYGIRSNYSEAELTLRKDFIRSVFKLHEDARPWIKTYQEEAFYFLPVYLALQLQRSGFYQEAADWFRSVYDFNRPLNERKIYYGLIEEETLGAGLERVENWLGDPLNPHAAAETRTNAYTRFTLLSIIRLLIDHANSEFTRYTADTLPRARTLYLTALNLLKAPELTAEPAFCEKALEELNHIAGKNLHPDYAGVWKKVQTQLRKIGKASALKSAVDWAKSVLASQASERERLRALSEGAHNQFGDLPATSRIADTIDHQHKTVEKMRTALFRNPEAGKALRQIAATASRDYARRVSLLSGIAETALNAGPVEIPWLGNKSAGEEKYTQLTLNQNMHTAEAPVPVFGFCIPDNPVIKAWALEAEVNLYKLHSGRDIAGLERQPLIIDEDIDVTSLPSIGNRGDLTMPNRMPLSPTPYRYVVLIERAKQLANMAQQMESYFLSALEKRDAEMYQRLKAGQEVELTRAGVRLNQLKVREAEGGVVLAELQRDRAMIQEEHYESIDGLSALEIAQLSLLHVVAGYQAVAAGLLFGAGGTFSLESVFSFGESNITNLGRAFEYLAQSAKSHAEILGLYASYERREQDWTLARNLARQDIRIGNQQIRLSQDRLRIVNQEHHISELQADHTRETLDFLINKFTNADLYDWMSGVLESVYGSFLQQATAVAQLAEQQLNFERQIEQRFIIQSDYWTSPRTLEAMVLDESVDRRGLTGSARLLQDIAQLDQYAFNTDQRKHELTKTISLAQMSPVEFQLFRQTGVLPFKTIMEWFDRDFPGHYLRLIKRMRISVIALVPPLEGIKATLYCHGYSNVVKGEPGFAEATLLRPAETVVLTSPINATGRFEFELQQQSEMRNPFEGNGVEAFWEFQMPKAANNVDYDTIADVLLTVEYTALQSNDYRRMIIQTLDRTSSADRPFSFRNQFADQWYDLNNPEETASPMVVKFKTDRKDFPPNVDQLKIQQVVLYFSRADGEIEEVNANLFFIESGKTEAEKVGGAATTQDGIISTRRGNGNTWTAMLGKPPIGEWVLSFDEELSSRFKNNKIEDILFVITFQGETPEWPKLSA